MPLVNLYNGWYKRQTVCPEWWAETGWLRPSSCVWHPSALLLCGGSASFWC